MFKQDNFISGILIGAVFPLASWLIFNTWHKDWVLFNKPVVPYLVAVLINLFLLRVFYKRNADKTARGLILITFLFFITIIFLKMKL